MRTVLLSLECFLVFCFWAACKEFGNIEKILTTSLYLITSRTNNLISANSAPSWGLYSVQHYRPSIFLQKSKENYRLKLLFVFCTLLWMPQDNFFRLFFADNPAVERTAPHFNMSNKGIVLLFISISGMILLFVYSRGMFYLLSKIQVLT